MCLFRHAHQLIPGHKTCKTHALLWDCPWAPQSLPSPAFGSYLALVSGFRGPVLAWTVSVTEEVFGALPSLPTGAWMPGSLLPPQHPSCAPKPFPNTHFPVVLVLS